MKWFVIAFFSIAAGAAVLAIWEWRKGRRIIIDPAHPVPHDRDRAAHTNAESIRAEGAILQRHIDGGMP